MTDPVMLLSQVHGEGRLTFHALRAAGFTTLGAVAETPLHVLADRAHLSLQTARKLKKGAEGMIENPVVMTESPGVPGRRASNGRGKIASFSRGVSLEEAELLGQGLEASSAHGAPDEAPAPVQDHPSDRVEEEPAATEALPSSGTATIAAAAEAASTLRRPLAKGKGTFWAFG